MNDQNQRGTPNARDWWVVGILVLGLGVGGLFRSLKQNVPDEAAFWISGFAVAIGLFLVIGSAVAHGVESGSRKRGS